MGEKYHKKVNEQPKDPLEDLKDEHLDEKDRKRLRELLAKYQKLYDDKLEKLTLSNI